MNTFKLKNLTLGELQDYMEGKADAEKTIARFLPLVKLGGAIAAAAGVVATGGGMLAVGAAAAAAAGIDAVAEVDAAAGRLASMIEILNGVEEAWKGVFGDKKEDTVLLETEKLNIVYSLLPYVAYFDCVAQRHQPIFKALQEDLKGKHAAVETARAAEAWLAARPSGASNSLRQLTSLYEFEGLEPLMEQLRGFYKELSKAVLAYFQLFALWDTMNETQQDTLRKSLEKEIPEEALKSYVDNLVKLGARFRTFSFWLELHHVRLIRSDLEEGQKLIRTMMRDSEEEFDTLKEQMDQLHAFFRVGNVPASLEEITKRNIDKLNAKITFPGRGTELPSVKELFISQPYRVIWGVGKQNLESREHWKRFPVSDHLRKMLFNYLETPDSQGSPLLILGHPGSGKSTLMQILAVLAPKGTPVIRVRLREVKNLDAELYTQIVQWMKRELEIDDLDWEKIRTWYGGRPLVLLLDGLDEIIQRSGNHYKKYLDSVQRFQRRALESYDWPIHAIVTSRITLINHADVPEESVVVRLEPFHWKKREAWIRKWNKHFKHRFLQSGVKPFEQPPLEKTPESEQLVELLEQPLLLFMLAMYDMERDNFEHFRDLPGIPRTELYRNLLYMFLTREVDTNLDDLMTAYKGHEKEWFVTRIMEQLRVAALAMFVMKERVILGRELDSALLFLEARLAPGTHEGYEWELEGSLLLSKFFFVQELHTGGSSKPRSEERVRVKGQGYEFMHATFGDFLVADFIVRQLMDYVQDIENITAFPIGDEQAEKRAERKQDEQMERPGKHWLVALAYTPLCSQPVVMNMMTEWYGHMTRPQSTDPRVRKEGVPEERMARWLPKIVKRQIARLLRGMDPMKLLQPPQGEPRNPFEEMTPLAALAVYTLNLVTLGVLDSKGVTLSDRDWGYLRGLWRGWIPPDALETFARWVEGKVHVYKEVPAEGTEGMLDKLLVVSRGLQEREFYGVARYFAYQSRSQTPEGPDELDGVRQALSRSALSQYEPLLLLEELQRLRATPDVTLDAVRFRTTALTQWIETQANFADAVYESVTLVADLLEALRWQPQEGFDVAAEEFYTLVDLLLRRTVEQRARERWLCAPAEVDAYLSAVKFASHDEEARRDRMLREWFVIMFVVRHPPAELFFAMVEWLSRVPSITRLWADLPEAYNSFRETLKAYRGSPVLERKMKNPAVALAVWERLLQPVPVNEGGGASQPRPRRVSKATRELFQVLYEHSIFALPDGALAETALGKRDQKLLRRVRQIIQ